MQVGLIKERKFAISQLFEMCKRMRVRIKLEINFRILASFSTEYLSSSASVQTPKNQSVHKNNNFIFSIRMYNLDSLFR
jgi:hypothetical protein